MASPTSPTFDRLLFGPEVDSLHRQIKRRETNSTHAPASPIDKDIEKSGASAGAKSISTPTTESDGSTLHPIISRWQTLWQRPYATWRPTFFQQRPLVGIAALCVTIGCVFASLAVLVVSDGQAVVEWSIQPTVYLAIVTAIANASLALARLEAVPVRAVSSLLSTVLHASPVQCKQGWAHADRARWSSLDFLVVLHITWSIDRLAGAAMADVAKSHTSMLFYLKALVLMCFRCDKQHVKTCKLIRPSLLRPSPIPDI